MTSWRAPRAAVTLATCTVRAPPLFMQLKDMAEVLPLQSRDMEGDDKLPEITSGPSNQPTPPLPNEDQDPMTLPDIHNKEIDSSTESLIKAFGLTGTDEKSLGRLLKTVRGQVMSALDELRTITTHDDNLERQYKEVVSENVQLNSSLDKARREIRHLKGQLSVLQMTSPEVRQHRARALLRERRKQDHERQIQQSRQKYREDVIPVLDFADRARTVNAKGVYVDHRQKLHSRHSTYPPPPSLSSAPLPPLARTSTDPLPPPLLGCRCSICNAQQSLGAFTMGSRLSQLQRQLPTAHLTKSGQQILLGDRVIIKGEKPGVVRYIGRLETDAQGQLFIGVHLVMPVGTCDGSLRGRHYFQCPPYHGVFVKPADVICVTGRKPCTGGTVVPRIQERAQFGSLPKGKPLVFQEPQPPTPSSTHTVSTMTHALTLLQEELARANTMSPDELFDASVQEMSRRMEDLARKNKPKLPSSPQKPIQQEEEDDETTQLQPPTPSPLPEDTTQPETPPKPSPPPMNPPTPDPPSQPTPTPSPQALPTTPSPHPPVLHTVTPPPPERVDTPLQTTLLQALQSKDLGSTGFVTRTELSSTLTQLSKGKAMSVEETEQLLDKLGIPAAEGGGVPYNNLIPYLVQAIEGPQ